MSIIETGESIESATVAKLTKDLREAARTLSPMEARFLVDMYYSMQENRIRTANQLRTASEAKEPNSFFAWFAEQNELLEKRVRVALKLFAEANPVGQWAMSIRGIGPVIAAGLLAHIDIRKAPTVGHIWSFGGYNPKAVWEKGEKRPWNADLKVIFWKIGESFVKVSGHEQDIYGKHYLKRKEEEWAKNKKGEFAERCTEMLTRNFKDPSYRGWYEGKYCDVSAAPPITGILDPERPGVPMLPPAHIHSRAKRYAVKLFLAHLHHVWYEHEFGTPPPLPYPIAILGHVHHIPPPKS